MLNLSIQKSIQQTSHCNYTIVTEICQLLKITLFIHLKTLSLLIYFWIYIKLMTLIRIFSVLFNGNNTINYFTNNCFQVLKQKLAIAIT
jgi:hypothetical protein